MVTVRDISRLKGLERILRRSERLAFLGRMLDDISHQIRNPVLSIGGFARRLAKMDIPRQEYVRVILDEAARLELLLETLTSFIGLPRARPTAQGLWALPKEMEGPVRSVVEALGARWELQVSDEMAKKVVVADARLLAQALEAVLVNACEAYEEPGRERVVRLRAEEPFCEVWVCNLAVEDSGIGVQPQIQSLVFDPFFTTKTGHLGMGLTFARRIIEEQAGEIVVQSSWVRGPRSACALLENGEDRCGHGHWAALYRERPFKISIDIFLETADARRSRKFEDS